MSKLAGSLDITSAFRLGTTLLLNSVEGTDRYKAGLALLIETLDRSGGNFSEGFSDSFVNYYISYMKDNTNVA